MSRQVQRWGLLRGNPRHNVSSYGDAPHANTRSSDQDLAIIGWLHCPEQHLWHMYIGNILIVTTTAATTATTTTTATATPLRHSFRHGVYGRRL